jgi:2-phospho-L-lactate/phosphoenolpyruvate guanylyltransferase
MLGRIDVIVPCKRLSAGKSRLAPVLSANERWWLCMALLRHTLVTAAAVVPSECVWLVTPDEDAVAVATELGVNVIADRGRELNDALDAARRVVLQGHRGPAHRLMIVPIDLPFIDAQALQSVLVGDLDVLIASDRAGSGTNVLCLAGAAAGHVPFSYGADSFLHHCRSARDRGYKLHAINNDALAFDVDEPQDLCDLPATLQRWRLPATAS